MEITGLQRFILLTTNNLTYNVMKCCLLIASFVMFLDFPPLLHVYDKYLGQVVSLSTCDDIAAR